MKIQQFTRGLIDGWPTEVRRGGGSVVVNADGSISVTGPTTVTGDLTVTGSINASAAGIILEDDEELFFGTDTDYWFQYRAAGTAFELRSTDVDGAGADGIVWKVEDGTDDVDFTGDITAVNLIGALTGNASTATALETPRNIGGVSFDGSADIVPQTIQVVDSTDPSSSIAMFDSATGNLQPKTDAGLTYDATTGILTATGLAGPLNGTVGATTPAAGSFTTLAASGESEFTGNVGIGTAPGNNTLALLEATSGRAIIALTHSHASMPTGFFVNFTGVAPNDQTQYFIDLRDTSGRRAVVWSDGSFEGQQGTFAGLVTATVGVKYGTTVTLTEGSANVLELATGDSFNIVSGTLTVGGDTEISDGSGLRVGHTAMFEGGNPHSNSGALVTGEMQLAGTGLADATFMIGRWEASSGAPGISFNKSRNASIGSFTVVQNNDVLGSIGFHADDGTDFGTISARIRGLVDDASPAASSIGGQLVFEVAKGLTGDDITEAFRLDADLSGHFVGDLTVSGGNVGIGAAPNANADLLLESGRLMLKESATPTANTGYGKVYTKTDDKLYFQDGAGVEHTFSVADYAAIRFDDNSTAETIDLTNLYHLVTRFATNGLDEVSTADQANNRLTIGASRDYRVALSGSAEAAGASRTFVFDVFEISQSTANITAITQATPGVVTAAGHGFSNGDLCKITGVVGMTEINDKIYKVAGVSGADFDLQDDEGVSIATGGFGAWSSGGTVALATKTFAHSDRTFSNASGFGSFSSHWYYLATSGDAMEFAIKNKSDATDLTFEHLNLTVKAL